MAGVVHKMRTAKDIKPARPDLQYVRMPDALKEGRFPAPGLHLAAIALWYEILFECHESPAAVLARVNLACFLGEGVHNIAGDKSSPINNRPHRKAMNQDRGKRVRKSQRGRTE